MKITNKAFNVSALVSKDQGQPALTFVAVWLEVGIVCAMDGHFCVTASKIRNKHKLIEAIEATKPLLVDANSWKNLFVGWKRDSELNLSLEVEGHKQSLIAVRENNNWQRVLINDIYKFPAIGTVWPRESTVPAGTYGFTAVTLTPVLNWFKTSTIRRDVASTPFSMTFASVNDFSCPLEIYQQVPDAELRALVMPHRL